MKLFRQNKYSKYKTSGLLALLLTGGILSGCIETDFVPETDIKSTFTEIGEVDETLEIDNKNNEAIENNEGIEVSEESNSEYINKLTDEYVFEEIAELGIVDETTINDSGIYGVLSFTDSKQNLKVIITDTYIVKEDGKSVGIVCDSFSKTILFKYEVDSSDIFYISNDSIYFSNPYFEKCNMIASGSIISLKSFSLNNGFSLKYVESFLPSQYKTWEHSYTNLEVAEIYIRLVDEKNRVTEEELCFGLDMEDPKIKILR